MDLTIEVLYSCPECGLVDIPVKVRARDQEDVIEWMRATIPLIGKDHHRRSPECYPAQLRDVKIPMDGTDKVGGPSVN